MNTLPVELVVEVFSHLPDLEAIARLATTSRHLHDVFDQSRVKILMPHIIDIMGQDILDLAVHTHRCPVMIPGDHVAANFDQQAPRRATAADVNYREIRAAYIAWKTYRGMFRSSIPEFALDRVCNCPRHHNTLLSCCEGKRVEVDRLLTLIYKTEIRIKMSDRSFGKMDEGTDRVIKPLAKFLYSTVRRIRQGMPDFEFLDHQSIRDKLKLCMHSGLYRVSCMILDRDARSENHDRQIRKARTREFAPEIGGTSRRTETRYWFEPDEPEAFVRRDMLTWYFIELNARHRIQVARF